jgi:hypothetical protein
MKILCASLFALLLSSLTYGQQTAGTTVGVCPFKALNTSQIVADRFTDLFAATIGKRPGPEAIVFGTVTQVESGYTLRISLVNVSQTRVMYEQTMNYVEGSVTLYSHYKGSKRSYRTSR